MRWIDPSFRKANYSYLKYEPITFYPEPQPTAQISKETLQGVLAYANSRLKPAMAERLQLTDHAGPRTLIFKGAITGVSTATEGLQFYEVIPVALVIAGAETASGHRTRDTEVYFEGELIDASTGKVVFKVVRKGFGKQVANDTQKVTADDLKSVVDGLAADTKLFQTN
ncbi:lipoprotein [Enterobacterales bacterium]|nr:lipoprotein [Enterobacterales bacterium]